MKDIAVIIALLASIAIISGIVLYMLYKKKLQRQRANLLNNVSGNDVCLKDYETYYNKYKDTYYEEDCRKYRNNDGEYAICKKYRRCEEEKNDNKIRCKKSLCNLLLLNELSYEEDRRDMMDSGIYD